MSKNYNPQLVEKTILKFWQDNNVQKKAFNKRKKKFTFLEGPPTLNASPHVGHFRGRALKDLFIRYKLLRGFRVFNKAGWDCQGLPVELMVEKELGFTNKNQIEEFGIAEFNAKCRERVLKFHKPWEELSKRLGMWLDWENAYWTMSNDYIEFLWWTVKQAYDKGWLFKSERVVHWCPRCQTSLSQHEVGSGYETVRDLSVFVKFPVIGEKNTFLLVWTTTPWTLPHNLFVVADPEITYSKVKIGDEYLILAKSAISRVVPNGRVVKSFKGEKLEGLKYESPFAQDLPKLKELGEFYDKVHSVIVENGFVQESEGTGLVHGAPGCGPEDYQLGKKLGFPVFNLVGEDGVFGVDAAKFKGLKARVDDKVFVNELEERGLLFKKELFEHEYPHCWRCGTPLIFIAAPTWFINVKGVKSLMLRENKKVKWVPSWAGERFNNWLKGAQDWNIGRKRYWGSPLPIWECNKCSELVVVGTVKELYKVSGKDWNLTDLHRPFVDVVSWKCECGGAFKRVEEVADVWLDSGVSPGVVMGFLKDKNRFKKVFPADWITEATDQTRGWYYTLMFANCLTFGKSPYKAVLNQGHVLDSDGKKMSKSKGNVVWAEDMLRDTGADVFRFFMFWSADPWSNVNYDPKSISMVYKMLNALWNLKSFVKKNKKPAKLELIDEWLISESNNLVKVVEEALDEYNPNPAARALYDFVLDKLSRFYVQNNRWRLSEEFNVDGFYHAINYAYSLILRVLSPFTPFICEKLFQEVKNDLGFRQVSVFFLDWPKVDESKVNEELEREVSVLRELVKTGLSARNQKSVSVKWPLREMLIITNNSMVKRVVKKFNKSLLEHLNVKNVRVVSELPETVKASFIVDFNVLKQDVSDVKTVNKGLSSVSWKELWDAFNKKGVFVLKVGKKRFNIKPSHVVFKFETMSNESAAEFKGGLIVLDTELSPELELEGVARLIVRNVQELRKELGLSKHNKVELFIEAKGFKGLEGFVDRFKSLTNSVSVSFRGVGEFSKSFKVGKHLITVSLNKL